MNGLNELLKKKLLRHIEDGRADIVQLCSELVKIPSENPPGDVKDIASFIEDWLETRGLKVEAYEPERGRVSLISKIGETDRPAIILNGHMDVVPAGNPKRWNFPPYCGEVKGSKVLGRGATDMKGGLTSIIVAFATVFQVVKALPGRVILNAVPDEETGGEYGSGWCVKTGKVQGDACLIGEPSGIRHSFIGEKGICWLRLNSEGVPAHGSLPMLGDNAIEKLVKALPIAQRMRREEAETPMEITSVIEASQDFYREMMRGKGVIDEAKIEDAARAINHNTVNIGVIQGGVKTNIVPESCTANIDIRVPAGVTPEKVKMRIEEMLKEAGLADINCEFIDRSNPNYTAPTEEVFTILDNNVREVVGVDAKPLFMTGATDGRFFRLKGIPTINYGPGEISLAHAYNEYVPTDDLIKATKVIAGTIVDFIYQQGVSAQREK